MSKKLESLVKKLRSKDFFFIWGQADIFSEYHLKFFEGHFERESKNYYHFGLDDRNSIVKISKLILLSSRINIKIPIGRVKYHELGSFLLKARGEFDNLYLNQLRSVAY